ncbi:MAG: hypothetical protein VR70_03935 [Rhodospirillaceae bacterium BRH_c57]|nr:MAG: hypothetical protein VR70_03935 [Rhodospirillaceae bacterium BRH_c57]
MLGLFRRSKAIKKSSEGQLASVLQAAAIDLVVDVGANVGQTRDKLRMAGFKGRIVSIEPGPEAHAVLLRRQHEDRDWVIAPRVAVGAQTCETMLHVSEASDMSSILRPADKLLEALPRSETIKSVQTEVRTLDDLFAEYVPVGARTFLKIDTQGYERQVLQGGPKALQVICGIQLELSLFPLYEGEETYLSFLNDLHAWGFSPHMIIQTTFSRKLNRQLQIDAIFMR